MTGVSSSRQEELIATFLRRAAYVEASYRCARSLSEAVGSYNDSLAILARATNPRARRRDAKARLHPHLEILLTLKWHKRQARLGKSLSAAPRPEEMFDLCKELVDEQTPRRGRPDDLILRYHVQSLMALVHQTSGSPARALKHRNSVYDPHMSSAGGRVIEILFTRIDPAVTVTAIANIVIEAQAIGAVTGKSFGDFFPFYGGRIDQETGVPLPGPGFRLERFDRTYPIYCR